MKNKIITLLCALPIMVGLVGCGTVTPSQLQTSVNVMNATVPPAVALAAVQEPQSVPYLRAAADAITLVAQGTNDSPAFLLADINKIPVASNSVYARPAIIAGVGIYDAFYGQTLAGDTNTIVLLTTFADDIRLGLGPDAAKKLKRHVK